MRSAIAVIGWIAVLFGLIMGSIGTAQEPNQDACFYQRSLHFTANGMKYWYSRQNGGLEQLTGIPYEQLGCKNCHVSGCDRCHKTETSGHDCRYSYYSLNHARNQSLCLTCHGREKAMLRLNHKEGQEDVHVQQEMVCTDCHSQREMHGDGTAYVSLKQTGAMDTACENCHDEITPSESHSVHNDRLDCKACHLRHVISCTNCHFDTLVKTGRRKAIPVSGWLFLMNYQGKVTSASMQTFVTGRNQTFLMFAPHMSHSITRNGRACEDCHGTSTVEQVSKGSIRLTWIENQKVVNRNGIIPVVDGVDYQCVYQDYRDGQWTPIQDPLDPLVQYAAFGKPMTRAQELASIRCSTGPPR
jgi:hypothetical protein